MLFTVAAVGDHPNMFTNPPEYHQTLMAQALGLPPAEVEVVDADSDVRTGILLPIPPPPAPIPSPDLAAFDAGTAADKLAILRRRVLG